MASIVWVDSEGSGTLTNGKVVPGDKFNAWTPKRVPVGAQAIGLGNGRKYMFKYRTDDLVSFSLDAIPGTAENQALMMRLQAYLLEGGVVELTATENLFSGNWATATLAPDTEPEIQFSDRDNLEYSFVATYRSGVADGLTLPFYPSRVAGLKLWLKADSLSASKVDSDYVSVWSDSSGNGNDALQATGSKQPTFKGNVLNGYPALEFDWTNADHLLTPSIINPALGSTLFLVAKRTGTHVEYGNFIGFADSTGEGASLSRIVETHSGDTRDQVYVTYAGGGPISDWYAAGTARGLGSSVNWFLLTLGITSAASVTPYYNGTAGTSFDPHDDINKTTRIVVGRDNVTAGNTGNNQIAEILLYDSVLSAANRNDVHAYIASKYGITVA